MVVVIINIKVCVVWPEQQMRKGKKIPFYGRGKMKMFPKAIFCTFRKRWIPWNFRRWPPQWSSTSFQSVEPVLSWTFCASPHPLFLLPPAGCSPVVLLYVQSICHSRFSLGCFDQPENTNYLFLVFKKPTSSVASSNSLGSPPCCACLGKSCKFVNFPSF